MSWKMSDTGNITMTKGDTPSFTINITKVNEEGVVIDYELQPNDIVIFAVKRNKEDGGYLFKREMDPDNFQVTLKEEDTKELPTGNYIYEVSLNNGEYHCTFIENKILKLTTEIY